MKTIEKIPTWVKGQAVTATIFNLRPIGGELFQSASFYYALLDDNKTLVAEGNLSLSGEDYQEWGDDDNYPYNYAAEKLNLVITGDYVEPVIIASDGNVGMATINPTTKLEITPEPAVQEDLTTEEPIEE
jgi:hypothetical protein